MESGGSGLVRSRGDVVEQRPSRAGRWLQERRIRIALWIAVIEGLLVALHVVNRWLAAAIAVLALLIYYFAGRTSRSQAARHASWILAVSQSIVVLIPVLLIVLGTFTLIAIGVLAVVALVALFSERP